MRKHFCCLGIRMQTKSVCKSIKINIKYLLNSYVELLPFSLVNYFLPIVFRIQSLFHLLWLYWAVYWLYFDYPTTKRIWFSTIYVVECKLFTKKKPQIIHTLGFLFFKKSFKIIIISMQFSTSLFAEKM